MKAIPVTDSVYWVGAVDWNIRNFHHIHTPRGSSYNAYLILDEKPTLIDTVKASFYGEMKERIEEKLSLRELAHIVSLHVEPDHSGSLALLRQEAPQAQIVTSQRFGEAGLARTFQASWPLMPMGEGGQLSLGKGQLQFYLTPMLHWPDNMMAYLEREGVLFSSDAFGQTLATSRRFDDEVGAGFLLGEASGYFANIFLPYLNQVRRALEKVEGLGPKVIAPSHGLIWRKYGKEILKNYGKWARGETRPLVLVIYDTMWGSTERMAQAIAQGVVDEGVEVQLHNLSLGQESDIIGQILEARGLFIGSPTMHNEVYPTVASFLSCLKGVRPRGRLGVAFGSFGWSGGAVKAIQDSLREGGVEVIGGVEVKFTPTAEELTQCLELGREMARRVRP